jgi:mRNA-degrading endonuclease RelE of RelBE toxin-antitoxin system
MGFMVILETSVFTKRIRELIPDEEYRMLQAALLCKPDLGALIPGSGGIRKMRWGASGRGKRGGARVIYYWHRPDDRIYMLLTYPKNEQDDLTPEQARALGRLVKEEFG